MSAREVISWLGYSLHRRAHGLQINRISRHIYLCQLEEKSSERGQWYFPSISRYETDKAPFYVGAPDCRINALTRDFVGSEDADCSSQALAFPSRDLELSLAGFEVFQLK